MARSASFGATFGAQANLDDPAARAVRHRGAEAEVPAAAARRGEIVGAYASASPAPAPTRSARETRATRQADGSFVLNGEKMWITNGGFADLFIVFAKVDGEHFTAFIVERGVRPASSSGKEEHKMGLHGSSTTPLILQDVKVPAENLLGEIGKGHKVAFNVLNFGRFKLGAMCSGGATARSAKREVRGDAPAVRPAEAQAAKAFVNEAAARVVDRALALSGGAGYVNGSPLARAYRDVKAGSFMHPLGANRAYDYLGRVALGEETALHERMALGRVQCNGGANERHEGLFIDLLALLEVDGTPDVALEAGVEEA